MDKFELFCMIYLALDADWEDTGDEDLRMLLSDMNPFLFKGVGSAIPDVYPKFCNIIGNRDITRENSYGLAQEYLRYLNIQAVIESFDLLEEQQWLDVMPEVLAALRKRCR